MSIESRINRIEEFLANDGEKPEPIPESWLLHGIPANVKVSESQRETMEEIWAMDATIPRC